MLGRGFAHDSLANEALRSKFGQRILGRDGKQDTDVAGVSGFASQQHEYLTQTRASFGQYHNNREL